ncbi:cupin domain-containing protein [Actinopolymorpha sp. B17G11]|uniref:cupin domain-containing protein n=1 Tax=Actinopolymorpha sp. B17G11 TaxID=3160861 RepID=UPI0032E40259
MHKITLAQYRPLPGYRVTSGGVAVLKPGEVSHPGRRHTHPDPEIFLILEGHGRIHIDARPVDIATGDVLIVEPGEDHHLEAADTVVTSWLHLERA